MHQSIDVVFGVVGDVQYSHLLPQGTKKERFMKILKKWVCVRDILIRLDQYLCTRNRFAVHRAFDVLF
jgi:hypothetical protein